MFGKYTMWRWSLGLWVWRSRETLRRGREELGDDLLSPSKYIDMMYSDKLFVEKGRLHCRICAADRLQMTSHRPTTSTGCHTL